MIRVLDFWSFSHFMGYRNALLRKKVFAKEEVLLFGLTEVERSVGNFKFSCMSSFSKFATCVSIGMPSANRVRLFWQGGIEMASRREVGSRWIITSFMSRRT